MTTKSMLGYAISIVGIIFIALSFDSIKKASKLSIPSFLTPNTLMIIGVVIVVVGIFLSLQSGKSKKIKDLPMYSQYEEAVKRFGTILSDNEIKLTDVGKIARL